MNAPGKLTDSKALVFFNKSVLATLMFRKQEYSEQFYYKNSNQPV